MKCVSYQVWGVCYLEMAPHLLVRPHQDSRSTSPLCHTVLRVWFGSEMVFGLANWDIWDLRAIAAKNCVSCPTCMRMLSSLAGLGMKPTSQPSLTSRPIHQLLSYFSLMCRNSRISNETAPPCTGESSSIAPSYATLVRTANATGLL